jgi:CDP-diacylglycerol--glycerol-3-phosphate 3-phosphatidyltransferase/cardiolipin synthase
LTLADAVTAVRFPLAAAFVLVPEPRWRLAIVAAAALSDFVDGRLARRLGPSRVGVVLDPLADKLFMLVAFLVVARQGLLAWWEILLVLARDILAGVGTLAVWVLERPVALPARAGGKAVTVCQLLTLTAFVLESPLVRPLAWATAAIAVYAIWDYSRAAARVVHHV